MPPPEPLAEQFEQHRAHLRAVAYRMLGSASEADDAVQESWIRLGRTDVSDVQNLRGWLTTVVARVCKAPQVNEKGVCVTPPTCVSPAVGKLASRA